MVLSATSTFVSYAATLTAMKAYVDGYHHSQHSNAPVILAIGTNNDMDVNSSTGAIWANALIDPLASYAAQYPNITIAGANDIEPGFIGSSPLPKAGYPASWPRPVLGSCSTARPTGAAGRVPVQLQQRLVNGGPAVDVGGCRTRADLEPAPDLQHHHAAAVEVHLLTGVVAGSAKVNFAGPLTEYTACVQQTHSCGSITNNLAWTSLWTQLQSDPRISQSSLPYGTDLRVN